MTAQIYAGLPAHHQASYIRSISNSDKERATQIINIVFAYYQVRVGRAYTKSQEAICVKPRRVAMYFIRQRTILSLKQIGTIFAGRDHSTVLDSIQQVNDNIKLYPGFAETIAILDKLI